ncbi:MAG: hypothetical protein ACKVPJ_04710 [Chitinophagales bacterium]
MNSFYPKNPSRGLLFTGTFLFLACAISNVQATISIVSFTGIQNQTTVELEWVTASEENTGQFLVQRSTDGINWETISSLEAAGFSSEKLYYTYEDGITPDIEYIYYRLEVVSADENSSIFSDIIPIRLTNNTLTEDTEQVTSIYYDLSGRSYTVLTNAPSGIYIAIAGTKRSKIYFSQN